MGAMSSGGPKVEWKGRTKSRPSTRLSRQTTNLAHLSSTSGGKTYFPRAISAECGKLWPDAGAGLPFPRHAMPHGPIQKVTTMVKYYTVLAEKKAHFVIYYPTIGENVFGILFAFEMAKAGRKPRGSNETSGT